MIKTVFLFIFIGINLNLFAQKIDTTRRNLTAEEEHLYDIIMEYRANYKLPVIPISKNLNYVALLHARDLMANEPKGRCNMHSWSKNGHWSTCCYTDDHRNAQCMWDKPKELTDYPGYGYENAFWTTDTDNMAEQALLAWKNSTGHNNVMINKSAWKGFVWKAIGIAIEGNYALIWFGEEEDKD